MLMDVWMFGRIKRLRGFNQISLTMEVYTGRRQQNPAIDPPNPAPRVQLIPFGGTPRQQPSHLQRS